MANPLDKWKHRTQPPRPDTSERSIFPLPKEPRWDDDKQCWVSILSKRLERTTDPAPDVKGYSFSWDGTTFLAVGQETISDPKLLRELNYARRHQKQIRMYFYVYLEEADQFMSLIRGIRKGDKS